MSRSHRTKSRHWLHAHAAKIAIAVAGLAVAAGVVFVATKKSPEDYLQSGKALQQRGDSKGAAIQLKNVLLIDPNNREARFLLGRVQFANGEYQSAAKELSKAHSLGVKNDDLLPLLARTLIILNQPQRLLDEVNEIKDGNAETNAAILAQRAQAHFMLRDTAAGEKSLEAADARSPDHPDTLATRARLAFSQGKKDEALSLTEKALAKAGQRAELWVLKADLLRASDHKDAALSAYAQALSLEPGNVPARLASAQSHIEAAALDKAEDDLKALRKYAPDNLMGRYLDALIEFRRGRYPEANNKLQGVLRTSPNMLPAHLLSGVVSLAMGNREQAKSHLNKVLEAVPEHPLARKLMAATLMDMGQADQAKELLASLRDSGNDPMLNSLQGEIALRQGDYAQARKSLQKAADITPNNPKLLVELAASRMGSGDTAGSIEALTRAAELDPTSTRPGALLVFTHIKNKQFDKAYQAVDNFDKEHPDSAFKHNLRGAIHLAQGDTAQARASFGKALQIDPGFFPAAANLARLDIIDHDPKAARSRFEQLLQHSPKESQAWVALAGLAASRKDESGYLKNLEQAKKADGKNIRARQLLARYWLSKKEAGKAQVEAREALDATGRPEFHELIGLAQAAQGDNTNALATFARWAELSPNNPMAHFRLALALITAKDRTAALKSLDKVLVLRSDFTQASLIKATLLGQEGRRDEGIKIARAVQTRLPKAADGYLTEAEILYGDKKYLDAAKLYIKATQLSGQGQPLIRAYLAYAAAGQAAEGEKLLAQWLKAHPNDGLVRHQLALVQLYSKRLKESADNYRILVRANPRDLVAYNNLAWLLGEMKDPEAVKTAESAYKLDPESPATLDTLGQILINAGQTNRGLDMLKKAFAKAPNSSEIHWHLAAGLAKAGDRKNALANLEILLGNGREFPQKQAAINLFNQLKQGLR